MLSQFARCLDYTEEVAAHSPEKLQEKGLMGENLCMEAVHVSTSCHVHNKGKGTFQAEEMSRSMEMGLTWCSWAV